VILFTCLFICGLFNNNISISDYTTPNDRMIMNNELERLWKQLWPNSRYYPGFCQKHWWKLQKTVRIASQWTTTLSGRDLLTTYYMNDLCKGQILHFLGNRTKYLNITYIMFILYRINGNWTAIMMISWDLLFPLPLVPYSHYYHQESRDTDLSRKLSVDVALIYNKSEFSHNLQLPLFIAVQPKQQIYK
jgi:hypothetical protein